MFAGDYAPVGWALCNGQLLPIAQNQQLFNLIGTTYGGNGTSSFSLPDLRGRVPIHQGQGPGLSSHVLGETGGQETVALLETEIPSHTHGLQASTEAATSAQPSGNTWAEGQVSTYAAAPASAALSASAVSAAGQGQPHTNLQPYLSVNFIIALDGTFPVPG
jgi:microcystin-dependent protein